MKILRPSGPAEARLGLRAMKAVALARGGLGPSSRAMMRAVEHHLLGLDEDLDALAPIAPEELARGFLNPPLRRQLVEGMAVMSVVDGVPPPEQIDEVRAFADALDVDPPVVETLHKLAEHHLLLFRLDFYRRSHLADIVKDQYRHHGGLHGVAAALLGQRGLVEDPDLAQRYHALEALPEESLGHQFFLHIRRSGFAFPGEKGGFPEAGIYHDLTHVLSGYGTDPMGEVQVGGFTAGYKRERPVYVLLFVLLTFAAGMNMTPLPQPNTAGMLATGDLAERFFHAVERGLRVPVDLSDDWDFWPLLPLPLDEVRARLHIAA